MSLRLSISEAHQRKIISDAEAREMRLRQHSLRRKQKTSPNHAIKDVRQTFCPIEGTTPQEKLWRGLVSQYPELVRQQILGWELQRVVPGRRYSLDMGFRDIKLGVELDGWEWHGKNISNFKRDRMKDRLLMLAGWRVLRFFASEVNDDLSSVLETVGQARQMLVHGAGVMEGSR